MNLVNLPGLIRLVNGCTKPESQPFKIWVSEVIAAIQRDGGYSLEPAAVQPAPTGGTAYVMPQEVADAIVRLETRNIQADEMLAAAQEQQTALIRQMSNSQRSIARSQGLIAEALQDIAQVLRGRRPEPELTPQQLLAAWKAKNLVFTEDIHAVAAYLAPALVRGEASYRLEDIATRTGLFLSRPRLPAHAAQARLHAPDGLRSGRGAHLRTAVAGAPPTRKGPKSQNEVAASGPLVR